MEAATQDCSSTFKALFSILQLEADLLYFINGQKTSFLKSNVTVDMLSDNDLVGKIVHSFLCSIAGTYHIEDKRIRTKGFVPHQSQMNNLNVFSTLSEDLKSYF